MGKAGIRISQLREKRGLTQDDLSKKSGVSQSAISAIEKGTRSPTESTLILIAKALGTNAAALVGGDEPPRPIIRDEDIRFALFGGENEITDEQFEEVKRYARYIKEREAIDKRNPS